MYLKTINELRNYLEVLAIKETEQIMVMVGDKSSDSVTELTELMNAKGIRFFGGIYPSLLVRDKSISEGFIINRVEPVYAAVVLPYLMRFKENLQASENYTAIVLVDGLSDKMKALTDTIFNKLGRKVKYIGGGAGFYDLRHRPCIFDNNGIYKDVLYVCIVKNDINLAVEHGWNKLEGPFSISEAKGNLLCKLDNYSAFEVYRDVIEETERITLYKEDFFIYAKDHPFGIVEKGEADVIVRDPIAVNENYEIVCVADIPSNSQLYILKGDENSLLRSSLQIAEYCSSKAPEKFKPLLFDCISRAMFLEDRFEEELSNIQRKMKYSVEGTLSIGEIATKSNGELVIHNKSTVLGLVENL